MPAGPCRLAGHKFVALETEDTEETQEPNVTELNATDEKELTALQN